MQNSYITQSYKKKFFIVASLFASSTFSLLLLIISYGAIIAYYHGYLSYFNIDAKHIPLTPHLLDFAFISLPVFVIAFLFFGIFFFLFYASHFLMDLSHVIATEQLRKTVQFIIRFCTLIQSRNLAFFLTIATPVCLVLLSIIYIFPNIGQKDATNQEVFTEIINKDNKEYIKQLVIYQYSDMFVTKDFNTATKEFADEYSIVDAKNKILKETSLNLEQ